MIHDLVREALRNAAANGDQERLRAMSLAEQAADLHECDALLEKFKFKQVFDALCDVLLETEVAYFLNKMQLERRKHRLLDPVHAIRFALSTDEGLEFLRSWNEGDWKMCAYCWPEWKVFE
ncbi:hypothetical protein [Rhizobium sp. Leaf383]|uniref:hypothetical protein n=1 Tax=Rhizobium sp. Leaf383 TaxID=1736357 RepID=UPI000713ABAB|nr:hypothetical protein [Rhizobium sp. Leaf383]KQS84307.1 hypothetical protein ASG58_21290 [Rhizobium sp. Leaf383]